MYSVQQFINENQGTLVVSGGGIKGQCVSLVQKWAEVNGVGGSPVLPIANARDAGPGTRQDAFTWIPNKIGDPSSKPIPGDLVFFSWNHTGLCISSDGYTIQMFQQNDPTGSTAHMKNYSFSGCTGWLRLKQAAQPQGVPQVMATRQDIEALFRGFLGRGGGQEWDGQPLDVAANGIRNSPEGQAYATRILGIPAPDVLFAQVEALKAERDNLQGQVSDITKQYQDLQNKPEPAPVQVPVPVALDDMSLGQLLTVAFSKLFKIK